MPLSVLRVKKNLEKYFEKIYSSREDIEISEVKSLAKGWETELFSFVLKSKEKKQQKEEDLILRIYPAKNIQDKIKWEYSILVSLFNAGYPVPKTHYLEMDESFFGKPFIIMDRIVGIDMGEEFVKALDTNDMRKITEDIIPILIKLFVKLHNLDWKIIPVGIKEKYVKNPYFFIDNMLVSIEKIIKNFNLLELQPLFRWLKDRRDSVPSEKISILHRDFHPHNIIISDKGKPYVVDWPGCYVGDFRQDLGWTLLLVSAYTSTEFRDIILNSYENESGYKVKEIDYFEVLAAFRRFSDILIMFKHSPEEHGSRDETIHQIRETIFHIENIYSLIRRKTNLSLPELEKFIQSIKN